MKEKSEPLIFAVDLVHSGTISRTFMAIAAKPTGLTIEEVCEISGMTPGNIKSHGIPSLLRAQIVEKKKTPRGKIFRLAPGFMVRFEGAK